MCKSLNRFLYWIYGLKIERIFLLVWFIWIYFLLIPDIIFSFSHISFSFHLYLNLSTNLPVNEVIQPSYQLINHWRDWLSMSFPCICSHLLLHQYCTFKSNRLLSLYWLLISFFYFTYDLCKRKEWDCMMSNIFFLNVTYM